MDEQQLALVASGLRKILATEWPREWGFKEIAEADGWWEKITPEEIEALDRFDRATR